MAKQENKQETNLSVEIDLGHILIDPKWNIRKPEVMTKEQRQDRDKAIDALAASIKSQGQITPIIVRPSGKQDKPFILTSGFTRVEALKRLKRKTVVAMIESRDEREALIINGVENLARKDVTPYETARRAEELQKNYKMKGVEIARAFGLSDRYVNNLLNILKSCHQDLIDKWAAGLPAATTTNLQGWASLSKKAQLDAYAIESGEKPLQTDDGEKGKKGKTKKGATPMLRRGAVVAAYDALLPMAKDGVPGSQAALQALRFVLGDCATIKVGPATLFDPNKAEPAEGETGGQGDAA